MNKFIKDTAIYLCEKIGPRPPGSRAEEAASLFIRDIFKNLGIEAEIESFESPSHKAVQSALKLAEGSVEFPSFPVLFSPAADAGGFLTVMGRNEMKENSLKGRIGLWIPEQDGGISSRNSTVLELEGKGLEALIVVSPCYYRINTKIVREPGLKRMPVVSVSFASASEIMRKPGEKFTVKVTGEKYDREQSRNVVAKIPGTGRNWIFAGAHYDSAPFCQGATDNAGGTAVLLGIAEILKNRKLSAGVYLAAFGSEEYGGTDGTGRGPWDFLKRRKDMLESCLGYINIDSVGCIPGNPSIYAGGPGKFRKTVLSASTVLDYLYRGKTSGPDSDFGPAEKHGIPYAWFTDMLFPLLHTPEDNLKHLDAEILGSYAEDIAAVIGALSETGVPYPAVKNNGITVRQAKHEDIEAICDITSAAFGPVSSARMRQDFFGEKLGGKNWDEYKRAEVKKACFRNIYNVIVAEKENKVAGYATYGLDEEAGIATIGNNAVHPDSQGMGIGKMMQQEVKRRMEEEGYGKFSVSTLSNDIAAQKIYEKLGYIKCIESYSYLKKGG